MQGVARHKVELLPHDVAWEVEFEQVKSELLVILGDNVVQIEHVGSTAVRDLAAKPLLDIAVVVKDFSAVDLAGMAAANFEFQGDVANLGKQYFHKVILFRDILRENDVVRAQYQALKVALAKQFSENRAVYTQAKGKFIVQLLENYEKDVRK